MRRLALAVFLGCVLSGGARAGEIHTTRAATPPSDPVTVTGEIYPTGTAATGEVPSTGGTEPEATSSVLTIILTLISIVP